MKVRNLLEKVRSNRFVVGLMASALAVPAFADTSTIDVSPTTTLIAGDATAAVAALGAAFLAFKYLKKVWNRI